MSKLSAFTEKLIEAGWLAAIVLAPLFFNVYSSRVFEPDKISLIRSIALVMIGAWVVRWLDDWRLTTRAQRAGTAPEVVSLSARLRQWASVNPLSLVALFIVSAYGISTLASLSPSVSLLGSYQRLEGTYTTFSYLVIFFLAASRIRTRAQVDRIIHLAIITSVPVAFFGILQHYYLDPLPWGGDTTTRVASNMGNSIFVGAFLIMVVPLVLARLLEGAQRARQELAIGGGARLALYGGVLLTFLAAAALWMLSFDLTAKPKIAVESFTGTLTPEMLAAASASFAVALGASLLLVLAWWGAGFFIKGARPATFLLTGVYALILAWQFTCLLFTESRGPFLGIAGGLFTFFVLYSLIRAGRNAALVWVGLGAILVVSLVLFNTANVEPITSLRNSPYIGRLGRVLDTNDGTTKVRVLIWQGVLQLILPHEPLWSPTTGNDALNAVRPLIGYGPEAMYVAYNKFYPPDLAHVESRNASPDRSHNETFDSLVTTGLIGFAAYVLLYLSVFYLAVKWLGFIVTPRERNVFIGLWFAGALVMALALGFTLGWNFLGVALPAGMIVGFMVYVSALALVRGYRLRAVDPVRALWITAFFSAIVAHFIEINFGIAIVSTNTYFWILAALLVVIGTGRVADLGAPVEPAPVPVAAPERGKEPTPTRARASKRARRASAAANGEAAPRLAARANAALNPPVAMAFLLGLVLATMGFDYVTSQLVAGSASQAGPLNVVVSSLTLRQTTAGLQSSSAMFWLFAVTLLIGLAILVAEWGRSARLNANDWAASAALVALLALAILTSFLLYHTLLLASDSTRLGQAVLATIEMFTYFMLIMLVVTASAFLFDVTLPERWVARDWNWAAAPLLAIVAFFLIGASNINIVQGDILYKQAQSFESTGQWDTSIALYSTALNKQPTQDYYLLFLGRAYLESAKVQSDAASREARLGEAERVLLQAQQINPLNTDHTANLGRIHRAWAQLAADAASRETHFQKSFAYYAAATRLSPNTAYLYNEWAEALMAHGDSAQAFEKLQKSYSLDQQYLQTYVQLGDYNRTTGDVNKAADNYLTALKMDPNSLATVDGFPLVEPLQAIAQAGRGEEALALWQGVIARDPNAFVPRLERGEMYRRMNKADLARQEFETAARVAPKNVLVLTVLANYYSENGEIDKAITTVKAAIAQIPTERQDDVSRYQAFLNGLQQLADALTAASKAPTDPEAHRKVATLWYARSQPDRALVEYKKIADLKPDDADAWKSIALLSIQLGQLPEAAAALPKAIALADKDKALLQEIQAVVDLAQRGDKAAALARAQDAVKQVPGSEPMALNALNALIERLK